MSKDLWLKAHEQLIDEAMELDPTLDWTQAYTLTAAGAFDRARDMMANMADEAKERRKYGDK